MHNNLKDEIFFYDSGRVFKEYPFKIFRVAHKSMSQPAHYHNYMQIWYVKSGYCIHWLADVEHELTKGNIFVLPPGIPHKIICPEAEGLDLISCEFQTGFIEDPGYIAPFLVAPDKVKPRFTLKGNINRSVEALFEDTLSEYQNKKKFFELYIKANIQKVLVIIAREFDREVDYDKKNVINKYKHVVLKAVDFMNKHYNEKIYLDDMCAIAGMSPTYFSYIFKQVTGKTFLEYLNHIRIAKAKEMLLDSSFLVNKISDQLGFKDSAYFNRIFKKETGISPGKFRRSFK